MGYNPCVDVLVERAVGDSPALDAFATVVKARDGGKVTVLDTIPGSETSADTTGSSGTGKEGEEEDKVEDDDNRS